MKLFSEVILACLIAGFAYCLPAGAGPLPEGRVWLPTGQPAAGAQLMLFDLADLHRVAAATTDESGWFALSPEVSSPALPERFHLGHNYPNPFNPSTVIPYQLPVPARVRLEVFNLLGQRVATLVDEELPAGFHSARWDGTDAAGRAVGAGVYLYRLRGGGMGAAQRMVLIDGQAGIPAPEAFPGGMPDEDEKAPIALAPVLGLTVSGRGLVTYVDPGLSVRPWRGAGGPRGRGSRDPRGEGDCEQSGGATSTTTAGSISSTRCWWLPTSSTALSSFRTTATYPGGT